VEQEKGVQAERAQRSLERSQAPVHTKVGRRNLTLSEPVLKAPMVSAFETTMCSTAFKLCFQLLLLPLHQDRQAHDEPLGAAQPQEEGGDCQDQHRGGGAQGRTVQVDPVKSTLKSPETKRLKLICDELLSSFAFKSKLRRYIKDFLATDF
jgi:hypothetical protein